MARSALQTLLRCGALCLLLSACAGKPEVPLAYKLYPGPVRPVAELAIVRLGDAQYVEVDGRATSHADWTEVHLLPGEHEIEWQTEFGVSMMIEPSGLATGGDRVEATLRAGHVYVLRADRPRGMATGCTSGSRTSGPRR